MKELCHGHMVAAESHWLDERYPGQRKQMYHMATLGIWETFTVLIRKGIKMRRWGGGHWNVDMPSSAPPLTDPFPSYYWGLVTYRHLCCENSLPKYLLKCHFTGSISLGPCYCNYIPPWCQHSLCLWVVLFFLIALRTNWYAMSTSLI